MAFWDRKKTYTPDKQLKKLRKYCRQVLGLSKEEAEKKAREWLNSRGIHPTDPEK